MAYDVTELNASPIYGCKAQNNSVLIFWAQNSSNSLTATALAFNF